MGESLSAYCTRMDEGALLSQWDESANAPLTPDAVTYGSKKKLWWRCEKGHRWQAAVFTRTGGTGCPYCAGTRPIPGENDFATLHPEMAAQWHPTKNHPLRPSEVAPKSHRKVWWLCPEGHEWRAEINSRSRGTGCPICTRRVVEPGESDLATEFPQLAAQWHPTKNGGRTPAQFLRGSEYRAWWRCEKGHEWRSSIVSRAVQSNGCPVCAGRKVVPGENDLSTLYPEVAKEWHPEKNGSLTPSQVTPYSNRKVWWICKAGHPYPSIIARRSAGGSGCPYCAGRQVLAGFNDLATLEPSIAAQWHPTLNGKLTPEMVTAGCHKKVWWMCDQGHVWKAMIYSRAGAQKCGCPICAGRKKSRYFQRFREAEGAGMMG